jgi:hypothetical protein
MISKSIESETGIKHVKVFRGEGYQYFYSDHDGTDLFLNSIETAAVYAVRLNCLTLEQWVLSFKELVAAKLVDDIYKLIESPK